MDLYKRVFASGFLLMSAFVFIATQRYFTENDIDILKTENKEGALEQAFPYNYSMREIYGFSNRILSPNEKIEAKRTTIRESDGFLQQLYYVEPEIVEGAKEKIMELNSICHQNGAEFAYINYPSKSNSHTHATEYGIDTNFEEIRADFLKYVDDNGVDYLNVRTLTENDGYTTRDLFYKTDHHWKTTAGFYTARAIADYLNEKYGWKLDSAALNDDKFTFTEYKNIWLGESGRNLSYSWANTLDDFIKIMPNYDTSISLCYADGSEKTGDFSMLVDSSGYENENDLYSYTAHYTYSVGMGSAMTYRNNMANKDGKKILIIKDSFSAVVIPFLALETAEVSVWDMREDDDTHAGLYQYIADNDFDAVLLAYSDFWRDDMWKFE